MKAHIDFEGPLNMTDHEFAAWLKERAWNGKVKHLSEGRICASNYITDDGKVLALVVYNNMECIYKVYVPKECGSNNNVIPIAAYR